MLQAVSTILLLAAFAGSAEAEFDVALSVGFGRISVHDHYKISCSDLDTGTYLVPVGLQLYHRVTPRWSIGAEFAYSVHHFQPEDPDTYYLLGAALKYDLDDGPVTWFIRSGVGLYGGQHVDNSATKRDNEGFLYIGQTKYDYETSVGANFGLGFASYQSANRHFFSELVYQRIFNRKLEVDQHHVNDQIHILSWRVGMGIRI